MHKGEKFAKSAEGEYQLMGGNLIFMGVGVYEFRANANLKTGTYVQRK
jgi:hypothetical protein